MTSEAQPTDPKHSIKTKDKYNGIDPYSFLDSKQVGDYLRTIECEVTAQQIAYFIWLNRTMTLSERHAAWNEVINKLPDEEIPESFNCTYRKSLHEFLKQQMALDNRFVNLFFENPKVELHDETTEQASNVHTTVSQRSVFYYKLIEKGCTPSRSSFFDDPHFCRAAALAEAADYRSYGVAEEDLSIYLIREYIIHGDLTSFDKADLADQTQTGSFAHPFSITLEINSEGEIKGYPQANIPLASVLKEKDLHVKGIPTETDEEWDLECCGFEGFYFNIPIPFEKGDIVCDCYNQKPFVLTGTVPWYRKERGRDDLDAKGHGDSSDMGAYGEDAESLILALKGTSIGCGIDGVGNYLNLISYPRPLEGKDRMLEIYSNTLKNKVAPRVMIEQLNYVLDSDYVASREWVLRSLESSC